MKKIHYGWVIVFCCSVLMGTIFGIEGGTAGTFFQPLAKHLGIKLSAVSFYVALKGIGLVVVTPFAYRIIQTYSIRVVLSLATIGYCLGLAGLATSNSIYMLYTSAFVLGGCGAFLTTITVPTIINNWFNRKNGLALGIALSCSGITGAVFGPIIAKVIELYGYQMGYFVIICTILILLLPCTIFLFRFQPSDMNIKPYGESQVEIKELQEKAIPLRKYILSKSFLCFVLFGVCLALTNGILFNLNVYSMSIGYSITQGAFMNSLALLGATSGKILFGVLNDYNSPTKVVALSCTIGSIGILLLLFHPSLELFYIGAFLYGGIVCMMTLEPPILVRSLFHKSIYSSIFMYASILIQLCYALGPFLFTMLYDYFLDYQIACMVCFVLTLMVYPFSKLSIYYKKKLR